jgi:hypothetical protein
MAARMLVVGMVASWFIACGGSSPGQPKQLSEIAVPNNPPGFIFDIGYADQAGNYFIADRTNKSVDMIDAKTYAVIAVIAAGVFKGQDPGGNNDKSGPDGVVGIPGTSTLYVGDVSSVKIVDTSSKAVTKNIPISPPGSSSPSGFRADEGCYDPDDKLMMFGHPGDSPPFITWISTDTQAIVAQLLMPGASGLEQCAYDQGTKTFLINNDGTPTFPDGELDVIDAASVKANAPVVKARYGLPDCSPAGLALGPGTDVLVGCSPASGKPLASPILNRTTGAIVATVNLAGADQVAYDSASNRYFMALRFWVDSGTSIGGSAPAASYNPILGVIDAGSHAIVAKLPAGSNAHSVAVDSANSHVFAPHTVGIAAFPSPGITVYSSR